MSAIGCSLSRCGAGCGGSAGSPSGAPSLRCTGRAAEISGRWSPVERLEVAAQEQVRELAVSGGRAEAGQLTGVIAPRLVAGEQQPVLADATPFDLLHEPARREPDRPAGVRVDLLAGLDPVEQPAADQLDVRAHPAAEVNKVDLDVVSVAIDQGSDLVDVRGPAGGRVHVHDQPMGPCGVEDLVRSEEHTSELQSQFHLVCRLLLEKKKKKS